jgi:hypothetical protein
MNCVILPLTLAAKCCNASRNRGGLLMAGGSGISQRCAGGAKVRYR